MEDISGSAVRTIILKPASAKTVLPTPAVQECFAPGANLKNKLKSRAASVKPVNFSRNSNLKVSISACRSKNRSLPKKNLNFILKTVKKLLSALERQGFV